MGNFKYSSLFQFGNDDTNYEFISNEGITQKKFNDKNILFIEPYVISNLTERAFADVSHLLRPSHLKQLSNILIDKEASQNDKFVALEMIKNANISAAGILPMCQDTGTAIVLGYKGENIFTGQDDAKLISEGIYNTYQSKNLRYSQVAPIDMFNEVNTNNNLPAEIYKMKNRGKIEEGYLASLTVIDLNLIKSLKKNDIKSRCAWSPFTDKVLKGWPVMTIINGDIAMQNQILTNRPKVQKIIFEN